MALIIYVRQKPIVNSSKEGAFNVIFILAFNIEQVLNLIETFARCRSTFYPLFLRVIVFQQSLLYVARQEQKHIFIKTFVMQLGK